MNSRTYFVGVEVPGLCRIRQSGSPAGCDTERTQTDTPPSALWSKCHQTHPVRIPRGAPRSHAARVHPLTSRQIPPAEQPPEVAFPSAARIHPPNSRQKCRRKRVLYHGGFPTPRLETDMSLIAFDFDGTLSDSEMTVLLGATRGVADEMAVITERSMNGEIEYAESLRERVALLDDLSLSTAQNAFDKVALREGAAELIADLRDAGHDVLIFTGGFERGVQAALDAAGVEVDGIVSNRLVDDGTSLTGEVDGSLVEGTKDTALENAAAERNVELAETVAVGDGANDTPMFRLSGLAIGFEPKRAVEPFTDRTVETMDDLRDVLEDEGLL